MAAVSRKDVILPGNDGQDAARAISLDAILESGGKMAAWNNLRVQQAGDKDGPPTPPTAHSPDQLASAEVHRERSTGLRLGQAGHPQVRLV